ncbi:hypothetical protein PC116_g1226 [Phytophthora cactorum]|uniref:Uncharacterized protein n=1 Tax=Phytophthora cactorum TaxID=29920 RepID=A0A8T1LTL8_9STRA|nr:hypothetical protein Pcac1_g11684 [Phytophthora cactorum]KAG2846356.1 hypothetical protein PC111_g1220 [Phytophthora cactorum]KAG2933129.1 hypothetical protein PC114_g1572 [Phytophthora cactorum]KAG2954640.1 hypothetical protein PC117_g1029 [Phytophthora cactorum]KAG2985604.1 hypothetical protein PC118_g8236 [Phytophthora cactorum]
MQSPIPSASESAVLVSVRDGLCEYGDPPPTANNSEVLEPRFGEALH